MCKDIVIGLFVIHCEYSLVNVVRPLQPLKAFASMLVTESGITIAVKPEQPLNVDYSITLRALGMVIDVRPLQWRMQ